MGRYRVQHGKKRFKFGFCHCILFIKIINQCHHRRNCGVIFQTFKIIADFFNRLMHLRFQIYTVAISLCQDILQFPYPFQKTAAALYTVLGPSRTQLKSADKHFICPKGVRPVVTDNVIRIYHIPTGFAHLLPVRAQNHSMRSTFLVGFRTRHYFFIIQEFVPEPGIQKMQRGMLHPPIIPIHRHPVFQRFLAG